MPASSRGKLSAIDLVVGGQVAPDESEEWGVRSGGAPHHIKSGARFEIEKTRLAPSHYLERFTV